MAQSTKEGRVYTEGSGTYGWSPVKGVPSSAVLKPAASGGFRYSMSGAPLGADLGSIRAVRPDPALSRPGERVLPTSPEHVRRERGRQRGAERGRRGSTQAGLRSNLQAQRKERVKTRGGMTEHAAAADPRLFEKGSFAEHKVRHGGSGDRGDPISTGRSSQRGGGGAIGACADYAARNEADSRRSSRDRR